MKNTEMRIRNVLSIIVILYLCSVVTAWAEVRPEITIQLGHRKSLECMALSPDGKFVLSGSEDRTLKLWDIASGKEIRTFQHADSVYSVAITPDGKYSLTSCRDDSMKLWDNASGKEVRSFTGHNDSIYSVAISPDGKYALSGHGFLDQTLKLWDIESGKIVRVFTGHSSAIFAVAISQDGKYVVSGSNDNTLKLWDFASGKEIRTFKGHNKRVSCVAVSKDTKYVFSGSDDKTVKAWEVSTGREVRTFVGHSLEVNSIAATPDGKYLLSGSYDETLRLWDIESGKEIHIFEGHIYSVEGVAITPDGKYAISGSSDKTLILWDMALRKEVRTFKERSLPVNAVAITPDGKYIISASNDETLKLWDLKSGKKVRDFKGHYIPAKCIAVTADSKYIFSGSGDRSIKLWDIATGREIRSYEGHNYGVTSIVIVPGGKYLLSVGGLGGIMKLWDIASGKEVRSYEMHDGAVYSIAITPDGKYALSGSYDNRLKLWDIARGHVVKNFFGNGEGIQSVAISLDGKKMFSGRNSYVLEMWDVETGELMRTFSGHSNVITSIAILPDGKYVATGSNDYTIKLWDIESGKEVRSFKGHSDCVSSIAISSDGNYIVSGSWDSTTRIWNIRTGEFVAFLESESNGEWLSYTSDGYWDASRRGDELVSMAKGIEAYNIDQFAVKNNRPDIILERLGSTDSELSSHYYRQYKKRLKKLGLTEEQLSSELHVPQAKIIEFEQDEKFAVLSINLSDSKYNLKSFNVYVNDVPLFGSYGKEISGKSLMLTERVELTSGENKIEVSCLNEKGAESYRAVTYAKYDGKVKGDLYFIGFGVSKYKDSKLNLQYAAKDVQDLASIFGKMKGQFANVNIKTYLNEQVTVQNIKQAREFLQKSKVDDTFILFISGHGVYDTDGDATYYYLTHNADLSKLAQTAANFELIEETMQGIAPRNKLFLMDTCESGEIEEGTKNTYYVLAGSKGLTARTTKGLKRETGQKVEKIAVRDYLYEKDRFIYNDLLRRSGAIVFSSSKGGEFSYEKAELENGLFTEGIIKALTSKVADNNNDGVVTTDELRGYVSDEVVKASDDLQHPTVDRDNIYQKFGFWMTDK